MAFKAVLRGGRWMIASGPIEFGPYPDQSRATAAADEINAQNAQRGLMSNTPSRPLVFARKAPRR